jgi:hypothetical protein
MSIEVYKKIEKCFKTSTDILADMSELLVSLKNNISLKDQIVNLEKYQNVESNKV